MESVVTPPNPWMIVPFGVLLAAIALGPLLFAKWWLRHYPKVAFGLGAITLTYYLVGLDAGGHVLHTAHEYVSFIALIGSLYIVSGGIHIGVKGEATPLTNVVFLLIGAVLANVLGTTGASMLLIRPWLRMNRYRVTGYHVVFFIFIVSNVGGCLTPIGDPPLFLGYLKGIPFWWVAEHCWPAWLVALGMLLGMFFVIDTRNYRRAPQAVRAEHAEGPDQWKLDGAVNGIFLAVILGAVLFLPQPILAREAVLVLAALGSWFTTPKAVHRANQFDFHPIQEVAILFVGIFATMMPALDWLGVNAGRLGTPTPAIYYWCSGVLSSLLDNAPTYLSFLSAIFGACVHPETVNQVSHLVQNGGLELATAAEPVRQTFLALQKYHPADLAARTVGVEEIEIAFLLGNAAFNQFIVAISLGAVFFGANTYIGNGPNFMVKAIAEQQQAPTPSFLAYVFRYALPLMLPVLGVVWWLFLRS